MTTKKRESAVVEDYLTLDEAAEVLKVNPKTLSRWVNEKKVNFFRAGRDLRFTRKQLSDFLAKSAKNYKGGKK